MSEASCPNFQPRARGSYWFDKVVQASETEQNRIAIDRLNFLIKVFKFTLSDNGHGHNYYGLYCHGHKFFIHLAVPGAYNYTHVDGRCASRISSPEMREH